MISVLVSSQLVGSNSLGSSSYLKVIMSNVVSPITECGRFLEEGYSTAWISLGSEGFELSDLATFELCLRLYIGVFRKGEVYPDTCYLLWSKEVTTNGKITF